jgi:hypothetical protein
MTELGAAAPRAPWAVWLMAAYIVALVTLPVDVGLGVAGTILTPARLILLAAVVLAATQLRSVLDALRGVPRIVWIGWAAFLGATLVTALLMPSAAAWARYGSLVGEGLVVFGLVTWAATAPRGLRSLVTVFALTMVGVAAVVLLLAVLGYRYDHVLSELAGTVPAPEAAPRYGLERQAGPFRAPLYFAIWMTAAGALLLPAIAQGARRTRVLAMVAWLALLIGIVGLTASRLALTTMFLLPAAYFLVRGPRRVGLASLVTAAAIAFGLARLIPYSPVIAESNELRLAAISPALQAIGMHPFFGWGLLSDSSVLSDIIGKTNYVDNTYLSLAVETGLVGLGAFLFRVVGIVFATWRGWVTSRGLALAIAVAGVLGMAVLASLMQVTQGYAAFFVLAALAVASAIRPADRGRSTGLT